MSDPSWDFGVKSLDVIIQRENGENIPNTYQAIVHAERPVVFYIGTDKYFPIEHRKIVGPLMTKYATDDRYEISPHTTHDGGRLYLDIRLRESTPTPLGDIRYGVTVINSLDGSKRLGIHAVILRPICENGAVATEIIEGYRRRHVTADKLVVEDFYARVEQMLCVSTFTTALAKLSAPCSAEQFGAILKSIQFPAKYEKHCRELYEMPEITSISTEERGTLWGAYNIISYVLTHETAKMSFDRQFDFSVALDRAIAKNIV